jgi:anti-sigma factor RsiW
MKDCTQLDPLVTPYVDGELAVADRQAVDQHLRACPPCRARVAAEHTIRDLIFAKKPALESARAPAGLRARCAAFGKLQAATPAGHPTAGAALGTPAGHPIAGAALGTPAGHPIAGAALGTPAARADLTAPLPARPWRTRLAPLALAAALVAIVGGTFVYQLTDRSTRVLAAELTADHLKCFGVINGVLGTHEEPAAVESSMASSFGWRMHLPVRPDREGLKLVGARPCLYGEGRVAHIMYRHNGRPVSVFMLPKMTRPEEIVEVMGHEAAIWSAGDRTFVLIAREPPDEVARMVSFVQASLH